VSITGTSVDVIHSFWAPEINGKMDLIPGKVNEFKLHADEPGTYRGQCAEFCGLGHAKMAFFLIVQPRDEFDAWLASQQGAAAGLTDNRTQAGRQVFFDNSCASCHGLTNDEAPPVAAPNLSHLATRTTIAGGTLSLTEQSLERWIRDPSSIKPGVNMPSYQELSSEDMEALVQFLLSLQ
jgi:cytochrome c oxidase subunit 2